MAQVEGWGQSVSSLTGSRVCSWKLGRRPSLQLVNEGLKLEPELQAEEQMGGSE